MAKISKENPKLFNAAYFLHTFESNLRLYDIEGYFMVELLNNKFDDKLSKIVSNFCGIDCYKKKFELLSKLLMFEEEAIVWNKDIMDFFSVINSMKLDKNLVEIYVNNLKHILLKIEEHNIDFTQDWVIFSDSILVLKDFYGIVFDNNFNLFELDDFDLINLLFHENVVIKDVMLSHEYEDMINYYYLYFDELEELKYE